MNRENIIVDMKSPTPIDLFRYNSKGVVDIFISKLDGRNFTIEIRDSSINEPVLLENCTNAMLKVWYLVEIIRKKAVVDSKIVNVHDLDSKSTYKKISLATTLKQEEIEEAIERQSRLAKSTRRRMVVGTPYNNRKRKPIDPRLCRPILSKEKTW